MAFFSEANLKAVGLNNLNNQRNKIKYLKRYIWLDREISRKTEEVLNWRAKLEKVTKPLTPKPKGGTIYSRTEAIIAKIVDLEQEINRDIDDLIELKTEIERMIAAVKDDRERLLLQYRYLDGHTFERIAGDMGYNWRSVHKIHVRALSKLRFE